jgi:hypothetical protein
MKFLLQREQQANELRRVRSGASVSSQEDQSLQSDHQHHAGNQAIQSLFRSGVVQASLAIGAVDDPAEHEADAIADKVTSGQTPGRAGNLALGVQRSPAPGPSSSHVPSIVEQALRSSGNPLDPTLRAAFEPRFGLDFSHVRIHTSSEAAASARSINALAYTAGSNIVFDAGQFSPQTSQGQRLLAHELAHVMQQEPPGQDRPGSGRPITNSRDSTIRRQPAANEPHPTEIQDTAKDEELWRTRVDAAVRSMFDIRGPGLTAKNVEFVDEKEFAAKYPGGDIEEQLKFIFWYDGGHIGTVAGKIFYSFLGYIFLEHPPLNPRTQMGTVEELVKQGIKDGYFWYRFLTDPMGRISPRDLIALYIGGITDISGSQARRSIRMQMYDHTADVNTLVHEACHFYVSEAFRNAVNGRKDKKETFGDAILSKVLIEGFAERFAREVMASNPAFGPVVEAYPLEFGQVVRLVAALGEDSIRKAYFKGDAGEIKNLMKTVDLYKANKITNPTNPDLMMPVP